MITFCERFRPENEKKIVLACLCGEVASDGEYSRRLHEWFAHSGVAPLLFTPSASHSLELACHLLRLNAGDEVILPSYNFPSAANAVLLAGGVPVLCDISPDTQNITAEAASKCVTPRTRAIIVMHYAGVACPMEELSALCGRIGASLIEDAAQGVCAFYKGAPLGTLGRFGAYSFHNTKNYSCGEGGALYCTEGDLKAAEIFRDKGTNRTEYMRGECDRYTWLGAGSSCIMSELSAALLCAQLESAGLITRQRLALCRTYRQLLSPLEESGLLRLMSVPEYAAPNGHIFYVRFASRALREEVQKKLLAKEIDVKTHYVPLHLSPMGASLGYNKNALPESTAAYEQLLRLPLHTGLSLSNIEQVTDEIIKAVKH